MLKGLAVFILLVLAAFGALTLVVLTHEAYHAVSFGSWREIVISPEGAINVRVPPAKTLLNGEFSEATLRSNEVGAYVVSGIMAVLLGGLIAYIGIGTYSAKGINSS